MKPTYEQLEAEVERLKKLIPTVSPDSTWAKFCKTMGMSVEAFVQLEEECQWHSNGVRVSVKRDKRLVETEAQLLKLLAEVEDWRSTQKSIMSEKCPSDEVHCTCVPMLKKTLLELEWANGRMREALAEWDRLRKKGLLSMPGWVARKGTHNAVLDLTEKALFTPPTSYSRKVGRVLGAAKICSEAPTAENLSCLKAALDDLQNGDK